MTVEKFVGQLWLALLWTFTLTQGVTVIKVGVIIISDSGTPFDVLRCGAAIDMGFDKVNQDILNSSYRIEKHMQVYGPTCDASEAPGIASEMYYKNGISALVGPGCTYALDPVARLAGYWNIPIITGLGDSGMFKNKTDFKTLTRMAYCQCRLRKVFGSVFKEFNWTDVALIMDRDDVHGFVLGETLEAGLQKGGIYPYSIKYYGDLNPDLQGILQEASDNARIIVLSVSGDQVRDFMLTAMDMGYIDGAYVFMDVELFSYKITDYWGDHSWERGDADDPKAKKAYEALLRVALYEPITPEYETFSKEVKERSLRDYGYTYEDTEIVNFFAGAYYDGLVLYGKALNESLENGEDPADGYNFTRKRMWNKSFTGITEGVFIDPNGDRDTSYSVLDMNPETGIFQPVAYYWGNKPGYNKVPGREIHWPGPTQRPPPNTPFCGFKNENEVCKAPEPVSPVVIALVTLLCAVVCFGGGGFLFYRRYKLESQLRDMSWVVSSLDLVSRKNNKMSAMSRISMGTEGSAGSMHSQKGQVFTDTATYEGINTALRPLRIKSIDLNRKILMEVKMRRSLVHDNICKFLGAVLEPPKNLVLHEYCGKGSLQDLLANDSINLDHVFRMSLIEDIVKGMSYIHNSAILSHGRLRSSNCLVDTRFILKLVDFGLPSFYESDDIYEEEYKYQYFNKLLWRAPEWLKDPLPLRGTQKADVYAFGIILEEIAVRGGPYDAASVSMTPEEIIARVKKGEDPPFRPSVPSDQLLPELRDLMVSCWHETPHQRPDFSQIQTVCRSVNKGKSTNLMDNLLNRMEQYANNLEEIVADRTCLLVQEQKKTEQLLLQILPKSIAEQLKHGRSVDPETYECVTIYFSDIVGFTTLSAESTPLEVVKMLNDLYTCFDAILENYDVYKVETIGDAYMVVSGLPERNGKNHAREIARMSLALLSEISIFQIRHKPDARLKLRIGMHSGAVVAGVVGIKMPRYCLFGDTVNTASRMESNGLPLKIHMSADCTDILRTFGSFEIQARGGIEVKGKGTMETYWLEKERDL